jgi:hypothetical protein
MHILITLLQIESKVDYEYFCIVQLAHRADFNGNDRAYIVSSSSLDKNFYINNNNNKNHRYI